MLIKAFNDANPPTYYSFLEELAQQPQYAHKTIVFAPARIIDNYDGNLAVYIPRKIAELGVSPDYIIVDDFTEALHAHVIDKLIDNLVEQFKIDKSRILFVTAGEYYKSPQVVSFPTFYIEPKEGRLHNYANGLRIEWANRTKIFLSLARRPCWHRVALTEEYIKRNLLGYGIISCGSDIENLNDGWREILIQNPQYKDYFPFLVDGPLSRRDEFFKNTPELTNAFVNVASETSHGQCPDFVHYNYIKLAASNPGLPMPDGVHNWHNLFVTEKTIKPFIMHQLPVFNTVQYHVKALRSIGIDVFDDIINHSYDEISDPVERINAVADEVERLCNLGVDYFKGLNLTDRFEHSTNLFVKTYWERERKFKEHLIKFLEG